MNEKRMSRGNTKLNRNILCWSVTPVKSCLNCKQCKDVCYALQPYKMWPNVRKAWDYNLSIAKDGSFVDKVIDQLKRSRTAKVVRIHVSGDFFSADYIYQWLKVVDMFPAINFYTYTKVWDIFPAAIDELNSRKNCNVINSITIDGGVNFGDHDRIEELKKLGYLVCPAGRGKKIVCGKDCNVCVTESLVCFPKH